MIETEDNGNGYAFIGAKNGWRTFARTVTRMEGREEMNEEGIANMHLIAASPDLLAALEAIRKWSNSRDGSAEADEAALTEINGIASAAIINATNTH